MKFIKLHLIMIIFFLTACSNMQGIKTHEPVRADGNKPLKIAIFFDGTANNQGSYTNVSTLYRFVTLQPEGEGVKSFYIEGVGSKGVGAITGWGLGSDVRDAYRFILENYIEERGDEIYIFGFSRGAYSATVLSSLLNVAGTPNIRSIEEKKKIKFIKEIYQAFKGKPDLSQEKSDIEVRRDRVKIVLNNYRNTIEKKEILPHSIRVKFLGLWDNVEALGAPDYKEDILLPNENYGFILTNVDKVTHAVSLDDNRSRIFTPILLSHKGLISKDDNRNIEDIVDEVWFSGAHSDIGGGYLEDSIKSVSFNWMLGKLWEYEEKLIEDEPTQTKLIKDRKPIYSNAYGKTHDPEISFPWNFLYKRQNRNITEYIKQIKKLNGDYKIKVHKSVLDRMNVLEDLKVDGQIPNSFNEGVWITQFLNKTEIGWTLPKETKDLPFKIVSERDYRYKGYRGRKIE